MLVLAKVQGLFKTCIHFRKDIDSLIQSVQSSSERASSEWAS